MARLEIISVSKRFGAVRPADGLTLAVEPGEIVAVFGPSGSGKTVLLRMIGGMFEPDDGDILVGGHSIVGAPPERAEASAWRSRISRCIPHMKRRHARTSRVACARRPKGATPVVQKFGRSGCGAPGSIEHVLDHFPRELSNGQKQRTALARALIGNPEVLLLDDPLRNVDAKLRYEMRLELPSLLRRGVAAALYVTQDYREAMAIADRIAVLVDGRFEQVATPEEVYAAPVSVAVARLFGDPTINLAEILPFEEHGTLFAPVSGARIRLGASDEQPVDRPCWLGVRPEHLAISREQGDDAIPARVLALTPMHEKACRAAARG